jgi:tRNA wybutosine-synthesizing protein 5
MTAEDFGVAINVFWKNLDPDLYDAKDPYGNKDLLPAAKSLRMLDNVIKQLETLPAEYRDFYARQLISRIEAKCLNESL